MPSITQFPKKVYKALRMAYLLTVKYKFTEVGKGFYMGKNNFINCKKLTVGNFVYIGNNCHLSIDDLKIGDYTMFASRVSIIGGDHRFDVVGVPIRDTGRAERKGVVIGKDCWLGHGVTVLDGVEIGEGAIIAACSVVTKSVEPYSIYAGIPAKKLRMRFDNDCDIKLHSKSINGNFI
jgi:chloramphenicol O-acetyltransferase type B